MKFDTLVFDLDVLFEVFNSSAFGVSTYSLLSFLQLLDSTLSSSSSLASVTTTFFPDLLVFSFQLSVVVGVFSTFTSEIVVFYCSMF